MLDAWREEARKMFRRDGFPGGARELWKYTDVEDIHEAVGADWRQGSLADDAPLPTLPPAIDGLDALRVVIWHGRVQPWGDALPEGVELQSWRCADAALLDALPAVERRDPLYHAFDAFNASVMQDGLCLRIAEGVTLSRPIHVLHLHDGRTHSHMRHHLQLAAGARAEVIFHDLALAADLPARLHSVHWQLSLGRGARCHMLRLQQLARADWQVARLRVTQQQGSDFHAHMVELGGALTRLDGTLWLRGEEAGARLDGLLLLGARQHVDHHLHIAHQAARCRSRQAYRSVLDGHARAVFRGLVHVHAQASGSDAEQRSDHILLSPDAEVDTVPELEIDHDDVRCAHGATVGQLDADQDFYLRSRGVDAAQARRMLIFAFADALLTRLPREALRQYVERQCAAALHHECGDLCA